MPQAQQAQQDPWVNLAPREEEVSQERGALLVPKVMQVHQVFPGTRDSREIRDLRVLRANRVTQVPPVQSAQGEPPEPLALKVRLASPVPQVLQVTPELLDPRAIPDTQVLQETKEVLVLLVPEAQLAQWDLLVLPA